MPLQKYVLHPITALLLGWGMARFVGHYHLLEFPFAPEVSFALFVSAYLLLSRKYDLVLSIIFFVLAVGIFSKSWQMKPLIAPMEPIEKIATRQLSLITALTKSYKISHGHFPTKIEDLAAQELNSSPLVFSFCEINSCSQEIKTSLKEEPTFVIAAQNKSDDKPGQLWYMTDSFEIFIGSSPP